MMQLYFLVCLPAFSNMLKRPVLVQHLVTRTSGGNGSSWCQMPLCRPALLLVSLWGEEHVPIFIVFAFSVITHTIKIDGTCTTYERLVLFCCQVNSCRLRSAKMSASTGCNEVGLVVPGSGTVVIGEAKSYRLQREHVARSDLSPGCDLGDSCCRNTGFVPKTTGFTLMKSRLRSRLASSQPWMQSWVL